MSRQPLAELLAVLVATNARITRPETLQSADCGDLRRLPDLASTPLEGLEDSPPVKE